MNVDLTQIHYLSGPVAVTGAEPGDCLVVDILDGTKLIAPPIERGVLMRFVVQPFEKMPWGYTVGSLRY